MSIRERAAAALARAEAATPRPWVKPFADGALQGPRPGESLLAIDVEGMAIVERPADAEFIAAAREDVPDLAAFVLRVTDPEMRERIRGAAMGAGMGNIWADAMADVVVRLLNE